MTTATPGRRSSRRVWTSAHFPSKYNGPCPAARYARAVQHLKFGGALRAQEVWVGGRGPARYARTYFIINQGGAAVRDVFSLWKRCRPLSSALW